MRSIFGRGDVVLLKPNMLSIAPPESAAITHPELIRASILLLRGIGCTPIVADSPAFGTVMQVAEASGIAKVCSELDVPILTWRSTAHINHPFYRSRYLVVGKEAVQVDGIINIPKFKTHIQVGFSGAIKNMFGCLPGKRKTVMHMTTGLNEYRFAEMLLSYCVALRPSLTIVDAIVAMHKNGPRKGEPYRLGMILASRDAIAADVALAGIVRMPNAHQLLLEVAREHELPTAFSENVFVDAEGLELPNEPFVFPRLVGTGFNPGRVIKSIIKNWITMLTGRMPE